jgi:hypothetical protein
MTRRGVSVRLVGAVIAVVSLSGMAGCGAGGGDPGLDNHGVTLRVETPPQPTTGPFVVVAVDNHFHDIHYSERNLINENRPFEVKNEGRNLHNFTVIGTNISIDIRPGHEFVWPRLGNVLKPGNYRVICKYHTYVHPPMGGHFTVTQ